MAVRGQYAGSTLAATLAVRWLPRLYFAFACGYHAGSTLAAKPRNPTLCIHTFRHDLSSQPVTLHTSAADCAIVSTSFEKYQKTRFQSSVSKTSQKKTKVVFKTERHITKKVRNRAEGRGAKYHRVLAFTTRSV